MRSLNRPVTAVVRRTYQRHPNIGIDMDSGKLGTTAALGSQKTREAAIASAAKIRLIGEKQEFIIYGAFSSSIYLTSISFHRSAMERMFDAPRLLVRRV